MYASMSMSTSVGTRASLCGLEQKWPQFSPTFLEPDLCPLPLYTPGAGQRSSWCAPVSDAHLAVGALRSQCMLPHMGFGDRNSGSHT